MYFKSWCYYSFVFIDIKDQQLRISPRYSPNLGGLGFFDLRPGFFELV
jgi:hypothetical protein